MEKTRHPARFIDVGRPDPKVRFTVPKGAALRVSAQPITGAWTQPAVYVKWRSGGTLNEFASAKSIAAGSGAAVAISSADLEAADEIEVGATGAVNAASCILKIDVTEERACG